ncbi:MULTISPECIES: HD domain-containing phosphohydrolase [unclassified Rhizobium]|uniref:HD domain-containing phosphohydrolase n=1 Tax=unclassified Rhizobium TaxID=2613769 RepID=UPI001ADC2CA3|nr:MULTISPECIES: HD domain-containing phosphohydrolase [unclassified Rhizobium]MBO9102287.1 HD domain-containing protein [Rhizobium sp. L58/93]MBO9188111.1 HD domain-containing protein [Rhizobium sp. E27B/91]QXZ86349.1 HD domain-containing protein [Rhizobium sp. K1/93]QXZ92196.1 HD domain-containing protein [Rhizobium sp. K15/93]
MRILLVDDNNTNLIFLTKLVEKLDGCVPVPFSGPQEVVMAMPDLDFDIAVCDFQMPHYTGVELMEEVRKFEKYQHKPFVVVTVDTEIETRVAALNAGAIDFLNKPVHPLEFEARMRNLVALTEARTELANKADWLRNEVDKAVADLREREREIIDRLTIAASYKDPETARHTLRVGLYSEAIARAYGLDDKLCNDIFLAAPMHDIGKVGIPDAVLLKKGKFTEQEFSQMQRHTSVGCEILGQSQSSLLQLAAEIAGSHHERWDGNGYPLRLSGASIPLPGRIVAIADNFDALTTERPYKEAWSFDRTVAHIRERAGTQFDPQCVVAFLSVTAELLGIMEAHAARNIHSTAA